MTTLLTEEEAVGRAAIVPSFSRSLRISDADGDGRNVVDDDGDLSTTTSYTLDAEEGWPQAPRATRTSASSQR